MSWGKEAKKRGKIASGKRLCHGTSDSDRNAYIGAPEGAAFHSGGCAAAEGRKPPEWETANIDKAPEGRHSIAVGRKPPDPVTHVRVRLKNAAPPGLRINPEMRCVWHDTGMCHEPSAFSSL